MKIAYDYQIFSSQQYGGISRYFFELANRLADYDDKTIECLINSPVYVNKYLRFSGDKLKVNGVHLPAIPKTGRFRNSINGLLSPLAYKRWHPNIVHETYYSPKSVSPPGCPIILTVHDMIHELYPEHFSASDQTKEYKKIAVERADHIICVSSNTRDDLICLLGLTKDKISVVHHGFTFAPIKAAKLPRQKRPLLLYVCSIGVYKNFKGLLSAYASRSELRNNFDLVAFGGGFLKPFELEVIQRLHVPLEQVHHIVGDDVLLASLYKQAALFVYPSLYEGFGIPPLEAMSFDCPVACSNTSSIPEVVGEAAIKFNPCDTDAIADALVKLLSSSSLRTTLINRGRARIKMFSWDKCAMETLNIYHSLF
jgi:glycosyltransferase involved in cell wall biosynthesis